MVGICGTGGGSGWDAAPKFMAGDWTAFAKSSIPGGLAASDGMLELTSSSSAEENKMACPGLWAAAVYVTASATAAGSSHRVKFAKLEHISNRQVSLLDNTRQK
jgi:hypothetical protein